MNYLLLIVLAVLVVLCAMYAKRLTSPQAREEELRPEKEVPRKKTVEPKREQGSYEEMMGGPSQKTSTPKPVEFYSMEKATLFTHKNLPWQLREELSEEQVELVLRLQEGYNKMNSTKVGGSHQDKVIKILNTLQQERINTINKGHIEEILKAEHLYLETLLA